MAPPLKRKRSGSAPGREKKDAGNKDNDGKDLASVFVRGLAKGTSDNDLRTWFEARIAPTVTCFVIKDDYGLVKFKHESDAKRCIQELQGADYNGSALKLQAAKPKRMQPKQPRLKAMQDSPLQTPAAASASSSSTVRERRSSSQWNLRCVQLSGVPKSTTKEKLQAWISQYVPGEHALESVRRALGSGSDGNSTSDAATFLLQFNKDGTARRAVEALDGARLNNHVVKATYRALEKSHQSSKSGRLIVRNLAFSASAKHVRKAFEALGPLKEVHLPMKAGAAGKEHRGFAFVQYEEEELAKKAVAELNGSKICGRGVAVDWAVNAALYKNLQSEERPDHANGKKASMKTQEKAEDEEDDDKEDDEEDADEGDEENDEENDEEDDEEDENREHDAARVLTPDAAAEVKRMKGFLEADNSGHGETQEKEKKEEEHEAEEDGGAKRNPGFDVEEERTIFVRNVPFDAKEEELRNCLERFGKVKFVRFVADPKGLNPHRGSAFVKFRDSEGASAALSAEAEADRKLKELSSVVRKTDQRDLPVVEGFGVSLKGRRLVLKQALTPTQATEAATEKRPEKGQALKERLRWRHLFDLGDIEEGSEAWEKLSKSEQRQRQASKKERKFRASNSNFAVHPLRLSVRNLPIHVDAIRLREAIVRRFIRDPELQSSGSSKKQQLLAAQSLIDKAQIVRDEDRRAAASGERRSRGFGFVSFKDHAWAMKALEFLNDNPSVFGAKRRPIVQFAIEDKRKLRMQQELKQKHGHKLLKKPEGEVTEEADKGGPEADAGAAAKKHRKRHRKESRGARQREKKRQAKKEAEIKEMRRIASRAEQAKVNTVRKAEKAAHRDLHHKQNFWQEPDAGWAKDSPKKRQKKSWELSDDFELKAMQHLRQGGR